jgi:hypothetical protein
MVKSTEDPTGTSFYQDVIRTTVNRLTAELGEPTYECNDGSDKVNFEWVCETIDGEVVTIYDWKEYRRIGDNEVIEFHIGGKTKEITSKARRELRELGF